LAFPILSVAFPTGPGPAPPPFFKEAAGRADMRTLILSAKWVLVFRPLRNNEEDEGFH